MTHTHISNSHLPQLSESRIDQMAAFASSHAQEDAPAKAEKPRFFLQRVFAMPNRVFAGAGLAAASAACIALFVLLPAQTPPSQSTAPALDISYSENTISEYIIQDFLDEMV